LSIRIVLK